MIPYTVPIKATETQVLDLVKRTQTTSRPLILALEGVAEPVAVVMKIADYEQTQRQQYRFYHLQLTQLKQWLERAEQQWEDGAIRQECVATWQNGIPSLWEVAPEPVRPLCASLMLAVKQLNSEQLSHDQIDALRYCLELLRDSDPGENATAEAYQRLLQSGIPPLLGFDDDSLLQMYLDEL